MRDLTREADICAINLKETAEALYMVIEGIEDESHIPKDSDKTDAHIRAIAFTNRVPMYLSTLYVILRDIRQQADELRKAVDMSVENQSGEHHE